MERGLRERWWDVQFYLGTAALASVAFLVPLGIVASIGYGLLTGKQDFVLAGVLGLLPGMAAAIWAAQTESPPATDTPVKRPSKKTGKPCLASTQ